MGTLLSTLTNNPYLIQTIILASVLGIGPSLLWLTFWVREDNRPEPKLALAYCFIAGMVSVYVAMIIEFEINTFNLDVSSKLFLWSLTEEVLKFAGAWLVALHTKLIDEPVDFVIYMIVAGIGFAALENVLFVFQSVYSADVTASLLTQGLRFIGATVLHTVASGIVGVGMAYGMYRKRFFRAVDLAFVIFIATLVHFIFNYFLLNITQEHIFMVFGGVWLTAVALILIIERVKLIPRSGERNII